MKVTSASLRVELDDYVFHAHANGDDVRSGRTYRVRVECLNGFAFEPGLFPPGALRGLARLLSTIATLENK